MKEWKEPEMPDRLKESPPLADEHGATPQTAPSANITPHTYGIKKDSRTDAAILLPFIEVKTETPKAICLKLLDYDTGMEVEDWFPKKLLSNMDTVKKCVHVWNVFMEEHKADLIPPEQRVKVAPELRTTSFVHPSAGEES